MPEYFDTRLLQENADRARREAKLAEAEKAREGFYAALDAVKANNSEPTRKAAEDAQVALMKISEDDRKAWYGSGSNGLQSWAAAFPRKQAEPQIQELGFGERLKAAFTSFAATTVGNVGYADQKWNEAWTGKPAEAAPQMQKPVEEQKQVVKEEPKVDPEVQQTYDNIVSLAKSGKIIKQGHSDNQQGVEADEALSIQMALVSAGAIDAATEPYNFKNGVQKNEQTGAIKISANDFGFMQKGGGLTAEALKVHQARVGLEPTGEADAPTISSLAVYQNPKNIGMAPEVIQEKAKQVAQAVKGGKSIDEAIAAVDNATDPANKTVETDARQTKPVAVNDVSAEALAAAAKLGGQITEAGSAIKGDYKGDGVAYISGGEAKAKDELQVA